jgi:hypothetical protein
MLKRYWQAYSLLPPPVMLQELFDRMWCGTGIDVYSMA